MGDRDEDASWERSAFRPEARIAGPLAVLIALGAPFLGGSVEPWSQGLILALFATGVCLAPPDRAPHRYAVAGLLAALMLACLAFFPSGVLGEAQFRGVLEDELRIPLALTNSPQPWISLEGVALMLAGILWWWWLITVLEPTSEDRARIARWTAAGMSALAAVALAEQAKWIALPFWSDFAPLGPFPNKNQMGDLLGTWAIVAVACGVSDLRKRRPTGLLWLAGTGVMVWALLGSASRGGMAAFLGGLVLWGLLEAAQTRKFQGTAIAFAAGLCGLSLFFAFGGETFQRALQFFAAVDGSDSADFRIPIFRDTFQLIQESSWCGLGLGNFEPVFALYRNSSAVPSRVLHPESDWLWLIVEMGWLAPVIMAALLVPSLQHSFHPSSQPGSSILQAAGIGGAMFLLHGLVDVSGHRLGSALPGLMLLALGATAPVGIRTSALMRHSFRIAGVLLLAFGLAWFLSHEERFARFGRPGTSMALQQVAKANASEDFRLAEEVATRALARAPLNWELYFQRAVAHIYQSNLQEAHQDFRRVRRLESSDPDTPFREGELWVYFDPSRSREAWEEALRRTPSAHAAKLFSRMISTAAYRPEMKPRLKEMAEAAPELRLCYLASTPTDELATELPEWLNSPAELMRWRESERIRYFDLWRKITDRQPLLEFLEHHPQFLPQAWRTSADYKAQKGDIRGAVLLALQSLPTPALPRLPENSLEASRREFLLDPSDTAAGYRTYRAEMAQGLKRDALATLDKLAQASKRPKFLPYLRAQVLAEMEEWEPAWKALQEYRE